MNEIDVAPSLEGKCCPSSADWSVRYVIGRRKEDGTTQSFVFSQFRLSADERNSSFHRTREVNEKRPELVVVPVSVQSLESSVSFISWFRKVVTLCEPVVPSPTVHIQISNCSLQADN